MNFCFKTFGCKVNQFETAALETIVKDSGHNITLDSPDAFIINTCTVTSLSDKKNIKLMQDIRDNYPNAIIAVCGCFAQTSPEKIKDLNLVDIICGTSNKAKIIELCEDLYENKSVEPNTEITKEFDKLPASVLSGRTRALLKIQDGCDYFCTYCIIPYARGRVRSLPLSDILTEIDRLQGDGIKEIMITGIEIASYGKDFDEPETLLSLMDKICARYSNIRFRLGSIEPRSVSLDFCKTLSKYKNIANHFHLSIQSGSNGVLKRMRRQYTTEDLVVVINNLRKYFNNPSITTDIIVGFPMETQEEFEDTCSFVKENRLSSIHVFPYSIREGTKAASMDGQIPENIKKQRANILRNIGLSLTEEFLAEHIDTETYVLLENDKDGIWAGHCNKHFLVKMPNYDGAKNQMIHASIYEISGNMVLAKEIL